MTDPYTPRYVQIEQALRARLPAMAAGAALPSDAELCEEFSVSRMTARQAVQQLVLDGLIHRAAGRGTFVAEVTAHRQATNLITFSSEMKRQGRTPSSALLDSGMRPATAAQGRELALARGSRIVFLKRLRLADGEPIAVELVCLRSDVSAVLDADLSAGSLHRALVALGVVPTSGRATIRAEAALRDDAKVLGVRTGEPLLVERRTIVDQRGTPLEFTTSRYAADRYSLDVSFSVEQD